MPLWKEPIRTVLRHLIPWVEREQKITRFTGSILKSDCVKRVLVRIVSPTGPSGTGGMREVFRTGNPEAVQPG